MKGGSYEQLPNGTLKKIEPVIEKPESQPTAPVTPPPAIIPAGSKQ